MIGKWNKLVGLSEKPSALSERKLKEAAYLRSQKKNVCQFERDAC